MSTYVLMRILESAPRRYDLGMRLFTMGGVERAYDRLAERVEPGRRVLDVGCGTGALSLRVARRGAFVKGIDVSAGMLEMAARRAREAGLGERITLAETGVAELDCEPPGSFDVVASGLCLSELGEAERAYTLRQARRILAPGGLLLVVDEVVPRGRLARILQRLVRAPLAALTWLVTQKGTHAVRNLEELVSGAGFEIVSSRCGGPFGDLAELVARVPLGGIPSS